MIFKRLCLRLSTLTTDSGGGRYYGQFTSSNKFKVLSYSRQTSKFALNTFRSKEALSRRLSNMSEIPDMKIELHVHLDGAIRPATCLEYARKRGMPCTAKNVEEMEKLTQMTGNTGTLQELLEKFDTFTPYIAGDLDAVYQMAYEFCEDVAKEGTIYTEPRFCPHLLANSYPDPVFSKPGKITPQQVVEKVCEGFKKGSEDFNVKVRAILCCMRHKPEWSQEVLDLCIEFKDAGVVAIDVAGPEPPSEREAIDEEHIRVFKKAKELGVHRTAHAGEAGSHHNVIEALEDLSAERIGHGYRGIKHEETYSKLKEEDIHIEICPHSSIVLQSVTDHFLDHPSVRLAKDDANFSVSTDDPQVFGTTIKDDYELLMTEMKLTRAQLIKTNFNAARSAFLPGEEKLELIEKLKKHYGKETPKEYQKRLDVDMLSNVANFC